MKNTRKICWAFALCFAAGLGSAANAQAIVSTGDSFVDARLLPGLEQEDGSRLAGLRLSLADGWKTYWRSPGEAGIPPDFDWSGSQNVRQVTVLWPRPEVFDSFGYQTVGYSREVVLPVVVVPEDPSQPMRVTVEVNLGVCKGLCVLEQVQASEEITPGAGESGAALVRWARAQVPLPGAEAGLIRAVCRISGNGRDRELDVALSFDDPPVAPMVLFEGTQSVWITGGETRLDGDTVRADARMTIARTGGWIDRSAVRMTVLADNFAADIQGCEAPAG